MKIRLLAPLLLLLPACDLVEQDVDEDAGFETGACIEGACFNGLDCLSDLCVAPDGGTEGGGSGLPGGTSPNPTSAGSGNSSDPSGGSDTSDDGSTGGVDPTGDDPTGDDPTGNDPTGNDPTGNDPTGDDPTGDDPTGDDPTGDDPTGAVGEDCDVYAQDCPPGDKCNPWSDNGGSNWNALGCFPVVPSPDQPGESCTVENSGVSGFDSCAVGSMCWDVDVETNVGTCVAMCEGSALNPTCSQPGTACTISNEGVLNLCLPACDPLAQSCPGGQGCYPVDDTFVCAPDASGGAGQQGDACEFINACEPGTACVEGAAYGAGCFSNCCTTFCTLGTGFDCPEADQDCIPWFDEGAAPSGFEDVGLCAVP